LRFEPDERRTETEWLCEIKEKFEESVRAHLVSDVPVGAFLSGGLDSSAVVAVASQTSAGSLESFSVGFEEQGFDELPFARSVAARYGTRHHESIVRADAGTVLEELTKFYDEPFADASAVPTYLIARETARHVKVVLTGDGGDEAFGGYSRYAHDLREAAVRRRLPRWVRRGLLGPVARAWPGGEWLPRPLRAKSTLTNVSLEPDRAHARSVTFCRQPLRRRLLSAAMVAQLTDSDPEAGHRLAYADGPQGDDLGGMLAADVNTLLPDDFLVKVDRATMAVSLEARPPFLDHELLELAARIPSRFKVRGAETKWLFKKICLDYLPEELVYRKKHGFDVPTGEWIRGPLRDRFQGLVLNSSARVSGLIDQRAARRIFEQHLKGTRRSGQILWSLLVLTHWAERYLDLSPTRRSN
jgi:asparagine synthase (glutamine-hydrolysing)